MKSVFTLGGVVVASAAIVVSLASPALAWHPKGEVEKEVKNVTQSGSFEDADTASAAVNAQPGDTLEYRITVSNNGQPHSKGWNDMYFTKVVDQLPAGVELAGGQTNETLGHIAAGDSKSYSFTAVVTSETDGEIICNTAEFTGDSEVKDNPQAGKDTACIGIDVPPEPTPEPTPEPEPQPTPEEPEAPEELPATGPAAILGSVLGVGSLAGASAAYFRSRRLLK